MVALAYPAKRLISQEIIAEKEFVLGLNSRGIELPRNWKVTVDLLNLFSLLDCLARGDPEQRPKQCADICAVIELIIERLNNE